MDLNEEARLMKSVPLFQCMDPAKLRLLAFSSERHSYSPGEVVCRQGEEGDSAFVILSGEAEVLVDSLDPGTDPYKVAELGPHALVGEMAVLCDRPRSATVRATTPLEALQIRRSFLLDMFRSDPRVMLEVLRIMAMRLAATTEELGRARRAAAGA